MNEKQKHPCCESFCVSEPFTRENYYFGKLLTAQALQGEQQYLNEKRWLINRYGIGWGVLCGLKVIPDCENPCGVIVQPGLALDQYGNEILICEPQKINLHSACHQDGIADAKPGESRKLCITIRYKECQTNPSPVPVDNCGKLEDKCVYNRTKETFEIHVTCDEQQQPQTINGACGDILTCESECTHFLNNPTPLVIEKCPPRNKWCEITLACICYTDKTKVLEHHIDNVTYRKLAFSNEMLYAMIRCLTDDFHQAKGDRHDRRQHVPLLANTIKGLSYQDGKTAKIEVGKYPFRVTSDGDVIWITDRGSPELIRIDRKTNQVIKQKPIDLTCRDKSENPIESNWGIAFDGINMWITHNSRDGKLTRINACNPKDHWTFCTLPCCEDVKECQKYCIERSADKLCLLPPYPQEVVYHQNLLYVSHGWPPESISPESPVHQKTLLISIIDTQRCCLVKTVSLTNDHCTSINQITSMVSDGDALWIGYTAFYSEGKASKNKPVVQRIKYDPLTNDYEIDDPFTLDKGKGKALVKLAFDGTHVWATHDDGASKINLSTGNTDHIDTGKSQVAIAYGGGDNIWTAEYSNSDAGNEARLNRIDIHSVDLNGEIEFVSDIPEYTITDAQFDGVFIYVSGYSKSGNQGFIHRILP